jgi:hypothetical protein
MKKKHFLLVFFVLLALGSYFAIPGQDFPETPYDESDPVPYEASPGIPNFKVLTAERVRLAPATWCAKTASAVARGIEPIPCREVHQARKARLSRALFCSFLC